MLSIGSSAPDFELFNHERKTVRLSDFRGRKHVVLAFHPLAYTPVCAVQMQSYQTAWPRIDAAGAHVLGISVDAGPSKQAWAESLGGIAFDLLSDFHPKGEVARAYRVMREDGISERAVFIIDKAGIIAWAKPYGIPEHPDVNDVLTALEKL
jgi:peroxiredoxin (alkyl hydroperoxide reductase subunit C)